jgi:toxin CcdB
VARFDVYRLGNAHYLDVQTDLLHGLNTRLVVPLLPVRGGPLPAGRLNPVVELAGELYSVHPQLMVAVPAGSLRAPVDNLKRHYDRIVAAIDMIFLGF